MSRQSGQKEALICGAVLDRQVTVVLASGRTRSGIAECCGAQLAFNICHLVKTLAPSGKVLWTKCWGFGLKTLVEELRTKVNVGSADRLRPLHVDRGKEVDVWAMRDECAVGEILRDPLLEGFQAVVVDDIEDRGLHTHVLLSFLRRILLKRKQLRVVLLCASETAAEFSLECFTSRRWFPKDMVGVVDLRNSRQDKRTVRYRDRPCENIVSEVAQVVQTIHRGTSIGEGGIVAFLPSSEAVLECIALLEQKSGLENLTVFKWVDSETVHVGMPAPGCRNCVLASAVLERQHGVGSAKLAHIGFVLDSMFTKRTFFDAEQGVWRTCVMPVTKEEARQRSALTNGTVLRMCTERSFEDELVESLAPEIQRTDICAVVLELKTLRVKDVVHFDFVSPPPAAAMVRALDTLHALQAVDSNGDITSPLGEQLSALLPLDPRLGKLLVVSLELGCSEEALSIAAAVEVLRESSLFHRSSFVSQSSSLEGRDARKGRDGGVVQHGSKVERCMLAYGSREGDLVMFVNLVRFYQSLSRSKARQWCDENGLRVTTMERIIGVRAYLKKKVEQLAFGTRTQVLSCYEDIETLQKCICGAFFMNAAQLDSDGRTFRCVVTQARFSLHPSCILSQFGGVTPAWIVAPEIADQTKYVCTIRPDWLLDLAPHVFQVPSLGSTRVDVEKMISAKERREALVEKYSSKQPEQDVDEYLDRVSF